MKRYRVRHLTEYHYSETVSTSQQALHLRPRTMPTQSCSAHSLTVTPQPLGLSHRTDYFGNVETYFTIREPHRELSVLSEAELEITPPAHPADGAILPWEIVRDGCRLDPDAVQYIFDSPLVPTAPDYATYAEDLFAPGIPLQELLNNLIYKIHTEFTYDPRATTVATPLDRVFAQRRGVCQDLAHVAIACLRSRGMAARYVSGYIRNEPATDQEQLVGADASHAWISVFYPGHGWIDADPTNNMLASDDHLTVAWGRDYADVAPMRGVLVGGNNHQLHVAVNVTRL